jgi:hypothetical protein
MLGAVEYVAGGLQELEQGATRKKRRVESIGAAPVTRQATKRSYAVHFFDT